MEEDLGLALSLAYTSNEGCSFAWCGENCPACERNAWNLITGEDCPLVDFED